MFLQLLVCSLMSITHVRIIITCFYLHNTLSRAYSPLVSDTPNPLICFILALTAPTSSLLNRFLPLLRSRLDLPPPPPVSQYYSRLNYKGASLGNICREFLERFLPGWISPAENQTIFKSGEDKTYIHGVMKMCCMRIALQSLWPSEDHKIYKINIIFVPMLQCCCSHWEVFIINCLPPAQS